ncbi:MAG: cobalamin-binding protein [Rhodothermales bacterium]|nr:cobalamin-binding protein [Rhodothermales bacterium]
MVFNRTSFVSTVVAIGAFVLMVQGCSKPASERSPALFTDALGRSVIIPDSVRRIVSLAPSATETLFAAGAGGKLVGVTTSDDYPREIDAVPRVTAFPAVDYERIVSLQPDLILTSSDVNGPDIGDRMSEFAVPVFYLGSENLENIFDNVRVVGTLTGTASQAETQARLLAQSVVQIGTMTSSNTPGATPKVLVLIGIDELYSFGHGSYVHEMIRYAGGRSITEDIPMAAPVLSEEFVLAQQPDVVVVAMGPDFSMDDLIDSHPSWTELPAVANDRVYSIDPDLILRPGPRVVDGVLFLATWISPEMMSGADTE